MRYHDHLRNIEMIRDDMMIYRDDTIYTMIYRYEDTMIYDTMIYRDDTINIEGCKGVSLSANDWERTKGSNPQCVDRDVTRL